MVWTPSLYTSHPRPHQVSQTPAHKQSVFAVFEVARVEFLALQKLGAVESQALQFILQFFRIEEQLKRLSVPGHAFGECIERLSLARI